MPEYVLDHNGNWENPDSSKFLGWFIEKPEIFTNLAIKRRKQVNARL